MNDPTPAHHPRPDLSSAAADDPHRVAVLGLGPMGLALAAALRSAGHDVVGWNRSPRPVADLPVAEDPGDAVREADVVLLCVRDHDAGRAVLARVAGHLGPGVPLVDLTSGTSRQAVVSAELAAGLGVSYVTGAIMVPTALVGTADNLILYAGPPAPIEAARPVLDGLGGTVDVLGEDHSLPPVLDMAMLDVFFSGMYAFLHSAAMVRARGVEPTAYLPYAQGILRTLGAELLGLAKAYETHTYDGGQASLAMCLSFLEHIVAASEEVGVDPGLPRLVRDRTRDQLARSGGDADWDVVAEGLSRAEA